MCTVHVERLGHGGDGLGLIAEGLENRGHGGGQSAKSLASHCGRKSDRYIYRVRRASRRGLMENPVGRGDGGAALYSGQVGIEARSMLGGRISCWA